MRPPLGFAGPDQFSYTVSDSRGASAMGLVNVTVGATNFLTLLSAPTYAAGQFQAAYSGVPGYPYTVEFAPSLTGPWTILTNIIPDSTGLFEIKDSLNPPVPGTRFYRVTYP